MGAPLEISTCSPDERFLRLPEVEHIVGLKRSTIYRRAALGTFPAPIKCGANTTAWLASSIQKWMAETISASRGTADHAAANCG
jgi:prophage regulatory protein